MQRIIVYLDDASYAQHTLASIKATDAEPRDTPAAIHWVLVACAPRLTHRISKWVSHSAREKWRGKWADKLFGEIVPQLQAVGDGVTAVLAEGPLPELTRQLMAEHSTARVLDARRPKFSQDVQPGTDQPRAPDGHWSVPPAVLGLGAMLALATD